jgi:hypothetical protein
MRIKSHDAWRPRLLGLTLLLGAGALVPAAGAQAGQPVVLVWNDLGMHCMNHWYNRIAVLPPYNNLVGQVILKGDAVTLPEIATAGLTLDYSIPGNTYSVGKTDFWTYAYQLFGVNLPPDIGLTGKGLTGTMDPHATYFSAEGIPITPFPDATPTVAHPYQQALVIVRDLQGVELTRSVPVIPVAVEMNCVSSGCHSSEQGILNQHPTESGFDPNQTPILCARCHADPALGTPGVPEAGYFSLRIHAQHQFIDETIPGMAGCYKCHPGPQTQCLRDVMNTEHGMVCQDCHGGMAEMASSIEAGRVPWLQEPACRTCHTSNYGEPPGQLFRHSTGHGGVYCSGCHGSPHAIYPSREPRDNANNVALQGHAGTLSDCRVCHTVNPTSPGPHGLIPTAVAEDEIVGRVPPLRVYPTTIDASCTVELAAPPPGEPGRLLVFDAHGRTVRLLRPRSGDNGRMSARWDADDRDGSPVPAGVYFVRWEAGDTRAAAKVVVAR